LIKINYVSSIDISQHITEAEHL